MSHSEKIYTYLDTCRPQMWCTHCPHSEKLWSRALQKSVIKDGRWRAWWAEFFNCDLVAKRPALVLWKQVRRKVIFAGNWMFHSLSLPPSSSPLSITDALYVSPSLSLSVFVLLFLSRCHRSVSGTAGWLSQDLNWRKLLNPLTGINEKIKRIFSINNPSMYAYSMCVCDGLASRLL